MGAVPQETMETGNESRCNPPWSPSPFLGFTAVTKSGEKNTSIGLTWHR